MVKLALSWLVMVMDSVLVWHECVLHCHLRTDTDEVIITAHCSLSLALAQRRSPHVLSSATVKQYRLKWVQWNCAWWLRSFRTCLLLSFSLSLFFQSRLMSWICFQNSEQCCSAAKPELKFLLSMTTSFLPSFAFS